MSDYDLKHDELEPGEAVMDHWIAGMASKSGRTAKYGGTLVLSTHRLIWDPIRIPKAIRLAGPRKVFLKDVTSWRLGEISGVEADPKRGALLHVVTPEGRVGLLISATRTSPIWSKRNREHRDAAVARISAALGA